MIYNKNKSRREYLDEKGAAHPEGGDMCGSGCCIHGLLTMCGFGWILQIGERGATRKRYNIEGERERNTSDYLTLTPLKGGGCGDCCTSFCCGPCALTQESQEIELEEKSLGKH